MTASHLPLTSLVPPCHPHITPPHENRGYTSFFSWLLFSPAGSKFRALVPPELGYAAFPEALPQMPTYATQRQLENHRREPLLFEVALLRVLARASPS